MNKNLIFFTVASLFFLFGTLGCSEPFQQLSFKKPELLSWEKPKVPLVVKPRFRRDAYPLASSQVHQNPPIFFFPLKEDGKASYYRIRLSSEPSFTPATTQLIDSLPFAFFNPHESLSTGMWFWQYAYDSLDWSEVHQFDLPEGVEIRESPSSEAIVRSVPMNHPRSLVFESNLFNLRKRSEGRSDAKRILEEANLSLQRPLPSERMGYSSTKGNSPKESEKLAKDASKALGEAVRIGLDPLVKAFLLTGERKYARAATRWALEVARWDPNGVSKINDFGDSQCMLQMAQVYDACYNYLSEKERALLLKSIQIRGNRFYQKWKHSLEAKAFSAHVWQHILERMLKTSLATLHELPAAEDWLVFVYELWVARSPILGPADGGWWNGSHYFELNAHSLLEIPLIFQSLTGVDFFSSPFYENNPLWLTYAFPPYSYSEGFGNGTEKQKRQKLGAIAYADALSRLRSNVHAAKYAEQQLAALNALLEDDDSFRWFRLRWELPERPEVPYTLEYPLAKLFPQTGTVNMHTDLRNPKKNLMLSMRSSFFGSLSHAHADQNSFNIQYGGERLFYNSGYRPSMGVPHYTDWFKASKGHNTLLIDGKGQPISSGESFGWIARFLHGEQISYALGEASQAYDNVYEQSQRVGLDAFRRHLLLLRPNIIVIYDELASDHEASWDWLLHSMEQTREDPDFGQLLCETANARARLNLYASGPLKVAIETKFDPAPVNYRGLKDESGKLMDFKDQWHVHAETRGSSARYLAVIQVMDKHSDNTFVDLPANFSDEVQLGDWKISVEMDPVKAPAFILQKADGSAAIGLNSPQIKMGGTSYRPTYSGSTYLVEKIAGKWREQEAIDEFPGTPQ